MTDDELRDVGEDQGTWARLQVALGVIARRRLVAFLAAAGVGLLAHLVLTVGLASRARFVASFDVQYRAGSRVLAGLGSLVGNLPSLLDKDSVETQYEIIASERVVANALRRTGDYANLKPEELDAVVEATRKTIAFERKPGTEIFTVSITGEDPDRLKKLAEDLATEYVANDIRVKRSKDSDLEKYVRLQIKDQEERIAHLLEIVKAHRDAEPLEKARDEAEKRAGLASEVLRVEARKRATMRDALLADFTPIHPRVIAAEDSVASLASICAARSRDELMPYFEGGEAQWANLRAEQIEETARKANLDAQVQRIRDEIGKRYAERLPFGSDPDQVKREHALAVETYEGLRRRLNQIELTIADTSSDIEVLSEPAVKKRGRRDVLFLTLFAAACAGLVSPFVVESLVVSLHTVADLERVTGLRALTVLPRVELPSMATAAGSVRALIPPGSAASDSLRMLRTNVEAALDYPARRLLLISSAEPGEGKSLIAANLAATYAEMGLPTLLVDLDLRRPVAHDLFRLRRAPGVTDVLQKRMSWRRAVQMPDLDDLHVLAAGTPVDDATALLATVRLAEMLDELRQYFAVVICDSPALMAVGDASLVAPRADAVLVVYSLAATPAHAFTRSLGMLATARAHLLGVIANDIRGVTSQGAYHAYYKPRTPAPKA